MSEFKHVPEAVEKMLPTGIFDISYTHTTSHSARPGIEKTGKIMAPAIALANDVVPFSGEFLWFTYLFRAYHVSVSSYPNAIDDHNWRRYLMHGKVAWNPESSEKFIASLQSDHKHISEVPYNLVDFKVPGRRVDIKAKIDGCIELEKSRQERWKILTDQEKATIQNPQPEIYVFGSNLKAILMPATIFGKPLERHSHPFIPAEINLNRYLKGMFTSQVVSETRAWISQVLGREIPVASIDALDTWEKRKRD